MVASRRNGRPLKQKHLSDRLILRIMAEEDEREAKRAAGLLPPDADEIDKDDHLYHLIRFGVISEPFTPMVS